MLKTKTAKTFAAVAIVSALALGSTAKAAEMTKEQVEKIVHDYLMANGEVILKSVDTFQRVTMAQRQADAVKNNHNDLFRNERLPFIGKVDGDVKIVEFFDYNCGYCKHAFADVQAVAEADKNVKIIFFDFPILGPSSESASKWALAAQKQNKYFEFHKALMSHTGNITDEVLEKIAKDLGMDVAKAKTDAAGAEIKAQIDKNRMIAQQMGVNGTPAFVIDDEVLPGAVDKATLLKKIAEKRAKPKDAPKADAPKAEAPKAEEKKPEEKKAP